MHFNLFEPKILPLEQVVEERKYEFPTFQRDFVWTPKKNENADGIHLSRHPD